MGELRSTYRIVELASCLRQVSPTPELDIRFLLSEIIKKPISEIFSEVVLTSHEYARLESMVVRRMRSEPIAYILGYCEFWGLRFRIDSSVLIPRPETECLVEAVLQQAIDQKAHCLDLGFGSGAIALALAHERPDWIIHGVDQSDKALAIASDNARMHDVSHDRVSFSLGDWRLGLPGLDLGDTCYDVVVSNPPYVEEGSSFLSQGTELYEPVSALYSGHQGLDDLSHIIRLSPQLLHAGGWLYLEHGFNQALAVRQLLSDVGFVHVGTQKDLSGHERISYGQYKVCGGGLSHD